MRLPSRDSATGRAVWTFLQTLAGVLLAGLASPDVMGVIIKHYPEAVSLIPVLTAVASFLNNLLRKGVKNY